MQELQLPQPSPRRPLSEELGTSGTDDKPPGGDDDEASSWRALLADDFSGPEDTLLGGQSYQPDQIVFKILSEIRTEGRTGRGKQ